MLRLIYTSYAQNEFTQEALQALLEKSRKRNTSLNITGVLFYVDDAFIQVLEGPDKMVQWLYETIQNDKRHYHCKIIEKQNIDTRFFQDWSMGFCMIDTNKVATLPGFNDFLYKKMQNMDYVELGKGISNLLNIYKDYCENEL